MHEFIKRSFVGIFFGAFLAIVFLIVFVYFNDLETINGPLFIKLFIKYSIASMILGWFFNVAPQIFVIRKLKLYQQTIIHLIVVGFVYHVVAFTLGWMTFTIATLLSSLALFIGIYLVCWIGFYLYYSMEAKKMSKKLQDSK